MAVSRSIPLMPVAGALMAGAAVAGLIAWRLNLQGIAQQLDDVQHEVKRTVISGGIPPTQDVMDYFTSRQNAVDQRYHEWLERVTVPPLTQAANADAQLFFQEQVHETQRTLERLTAAREMPVPDQLGFPKELPPSETVPRLLCQLTLIREASTLMLEQGAKRLVSVKIEDPETVQEEEEGGGPFLMRLPVRVRLMGTLPQMMKVFGAIERARPLMDLRAVRMAQAESSEDLEAELVVARYLLVADVGDVAQEEEHRYDETKPASGVGRKSARSEKEP